MHHLVSPRVFADADMKVKKSEEIPEKAFSRRRLWVALGMVRQDCRGNRIEVSRFESQPTRNRRTPPLSKSIKNVR